MSLRFNPMRTVTLEAEIRDQAATIIDLKRTLREAEEKLEASRDQVRLLQEMLAEVEASRQRMTENAAAFASALAERRAENEVTAKRLAGATELLRLEIMGFRAEDSATPRENERD